MLKHFQFFSIQFKDCLFGTGFKFQELLSSKKGFFAYNSKINCNKSTLLNCKNQLSVRQAKDRNKVLSISLFSKQAIKLSGANVRYKTFDKRVLWISKHNFCIFLSSV